MKFTIFGASGFIGSKLSEYLIQCGHEVHTPKRAEIPPPSEKLGHVIYAIGLTGDFRSRPYDTVNAHVQELVNRIRDSSFDSWLYLSSTRIYSNSIDGVNEEAPIYVTPGSDGIYDVSKLLGESLCLALNQPNIRIARLANVYGEKQSCHTFLGSLLQDVIAGRNIVIKEESESAKDYISIHDVVQLIEKIAVHGKERIYNVATGSPISHLALAEKLIKLTGINITFSAEMGRRAFPRININRITQEFEYRPRNLIEDLSDLLLAPTNNLNRTHYDSK